MVQIAFVYPLVLSIKVQLVHTESSQYVFRLPLFLIRILIKHTQTFHDIAATGILDIVCGRNVRNAIFLCLVNNGIGRLGYNAVAPKGFEQPIAKVMGLIDVYIDIPYWNVIIF